VCVTNVILDYFDINLFFVSVQEEVRGQGVKEDNQLIQHHNEENYEDEDEEEEGNGDKPPIRRAEM